MKIGFPVSSKTGEPIGLKTIDRAVFDDNGVPLSDRLAQIIADMSTDNVYKQAVQEGYTESAEKFNSDLIQAIIMADSEDSEDVLPESEINDDIVSLASTWSSKKISDLLKSINGGVDSINFYIPLIEQSNETYTTDTTLEEIEEAFQAGKIVWVLSSGMLLPLRQRVSSVEWIFSGYMDAKAYDVTISAAGVVLSLVEVATVKALRALEETTMEKLNTIPEVTVEDNGKFLCVVDGAWSAVVIPNAEGEAY